MLPFTWNTHHEHTFLFLLDIFNQVMNMTDHSSYWLLFFLLNNLSFKYMLIFALWLFSQLKYTTTFFLMTIHLEDCSWPILCILVFD